MEHLIRGQTSTESKRDGIGRCEISMIMRVYERVKIKEADEGEDKWTGKIMHGQFVR